MNTNVDFCYVKCVLEDVKSYKASLNEIVLFEFFAQSLISSKYVVNIDRHEYCLRRK